MRRSAKGATHSVALEPVGIEAPVRGEKKKTWFHDEVIGFFSSLVFAFKYVFSDTRKHLGSFLIGFITIVIVVLVVSVLYNTILKAPIIFMKLAEDQVGEADIMLTPKFSNTSTNPFINFTQLEQKLSSNTLVTGISPRWVMFSNLYNRDTPTKNISATLLLIDSAKEAELGVGRDWPLRVLGEGEVQVRNTLLRALDTRSDRGERIMVQLDINSLAGILTGRSESISQGLDPSSDLPTGPINQTQLILALLQTIGVNMSETYQVNVTALAERFHFKIPPALQRIIDIMGPVINVPGSFLFEALNSQITAMGGLNNIFMAEYNVVGSIDQPYGKYPGALGNLAMVDYHWFIKGIGKHMQDNTNFRLLLAAFGAEAQFETFIKSFDLSNYAISVVGMYKNRFSCYIKSEKDLNREMITLTNSIVDTLTVQYPVSIILPLVQTLAASKFISLFLDQIFLFVVVMLAILGIILMFSLLLANVEERTYEFGMLRALGLKQTSLIQVILSQTILFAIPGIILAMILSFGINSIVEIIIGKVVRFPLSQLDFSFNWIAIVVPIALGLLIPLVSNIVPIQRALSRTLRDSLDITHQQFNETTVRMIKLSELGLEPWQTSLSIVLVVIGFIVYYVIPYSFIFQNLPLFFFILNGILLGMLLGLCMIAIVIQPVFEHAILSVMLCCGPDRVLKTLVSKNLAGHRKRSRKTFLMFTLSVAFIIFAGVMFSLQTSNIVQSVELLVGADISVQSSTKSYPLPVATLKNYLDREKSEKRIVDYAYASFDLRKMGMMSGTVRFSSLAYYPTRSVRVHALTPNFLSVAYNKYFLYTQLDRELTYGTVQGKPDVVKSLYTDAGKAHVTGERPGFAPSVIFTGRGIGVSVNETLSFDPSEKYRTYLDVIISEAMKDEVSINVKSPMQVKIGASNRKLGLSGSQDFIAKARAMVYKMPGFLYSSYRLAASGSPILITTNAFQQVMERAAQSVKYTEYKMTEPPMERLFIRTLPGLNSTQRADMLNGLRSLLDSDFSSITDVVDIVAATQTSTLVLMGFFNIVAAIAVVLCFFILMLSFTANVRENSWEFGVLRAVGLNVNQLIRAYIYEALCLVISAFACGTVIGVVIALTLTAQFNLFLEMPFQFDFPYYLFASVGVMAVAVAIIGSYLPARQLRGKEIALVLRGLE